MKLEYIIVYMASAVFFIIGLTFPSEEIECYSYGSGCSIEQVEMAGVSNYIPIISFITSITLFLLPSAINNIGEDAKSCEQIRRLSK